MQKSGGVKTVSIIDTLSELVGTDAASQLEISTSTKQFQLPPQQQQQQQQLPPPPQLQPRSPKVVVPSTPEAGVRKRPQASASPQRRNSNNNSTYVLQVEICKTFYHLYEVKAYIPAKSQNLPNAQRCQLHYLLAYFASDCRCWWMS